MSIRIIEFDLLAEGRLIKRYKRFLADIELDDGRKITAHCPNTGPMRGLLDQDTRVRVSFNPSPSRKLQWTWEQVLVISSRNSKIWVGTNTLLANRLIRKVIDKGILDSHIGEIDQIKAEKTYGQDNKSRIDFLLTPKCSNPDKRNIYIEVKNTTWTNGNVALFPDTLTMRGQKHLRELISISPNSKSILIPCITRTDVDYFSPGDEADPNYGKLFRQSLKKGVMVLPCCFSFKRDHIDWERFVPVLSQ